MTATLFGHEETFKWLRHMPPAFREWMEEQFERDLNELRTASDLRVLGQCQGRLYILDLLKEAGKEFLNVVEQGAITT